MLVKIEHAGLIAVLTIDNPPVNATSHALRSALKAALDEVLADAAVHAVILIGAGRGFIAGADISEFDRVRPEPLNPTIIATMEQATKPIVAAIHGHALGGGLELAMGCHYRIATAEARFGQPEVKIGLTPGAGGTQRLPRLVGIPLALDMIVGGDPIDAQKALACGLVDAIIAGALRQGAISFAEGLIRDKKPLRRVRDLPAPAADAEAFARARADLAKRKTVLLAPQSCVAAVEASLLSFDQGLKRERELFAETVKSDQSRALRHMFFAERDTAKTASVPPDTQAATIQSVAVIGGGTMGSAIAICCADAGLPVTLVEADSAAIERAMRNLRLHYAASAKRANLPPAEIEARLQRVTPSISIGDVRGADLVIEAVIEDLALKKDIFTALDRAAKPEAILATNTSYLDIDALAAVTQNPARVLGLHFFAPATIMRVMEVVRAAKSSPSTLAAGMAFGRKIRKIPVMVGACDGFVGNRLLTQRGREVERLLSDGVAIAAIDEAMISFGFPQGPCAAGDLAGLDISYRARKQRGRHWPLADAVVDAGRLGQKTGVGYYRYEPGSRAPLPDPEAQRIIDKARGSEQRMTLSAEEIVTRIIDPMINEGARLLAEGIAERAGDIDVIWVYGYGFPAYRGGPMFHADLTGLGAICDRLTQSAERFNDPSLRPAALLARLAQEGKGFKDFSRN